MKNILKNNKIQFLYLLLIFLISLIVMLSNLGWHKDFVGTDSGVSYSFPDILVNFVYYTWDGFTAPGKINITSVFGFLWINFVFGLFRLGLDPFVIKRLAYFLFFATSGWGAFFLSAILIKKYDNTLKKNIVYFGALTGSLLYMFNHFTMQMASFPIIPYHLSYMLLPWALTLFLYNLQIKTSFINTLLFLIVFLFLLNGNPSNTFSIVLFLIAYVLFLVPQVQVKKNSPKPILFLTISFILILFLCSYIYLPIIAVESNPYGKLVKISVDFNSVHTSFLNLFRLAGLNTWSNYPYYNLYTHNALFIFLGYLISILVIASVFIQGGERIKIFFSLVIIFILFLAKGTHSPFEKLSSFLFFKIPYFGMYRAVYHKFVFFVALSYSVLISFFVSQSFAFLENHYRKFKHVVILIPLIICIYGWPFFSNSIVQRDYLTVIPGDYEQLRSTLRNDPSDFKILSVPPAPGGGSLLLKWADNNKYVGRHPDKFFFSNSVLDSYWFIANGLVEANPWIDMKFESNIDSVSNYRNILNIRYIFLHKDFVEKHDFKFGGGLKIIKGKLRAKIIESILRQQKEVELIKDSKYYALYKLSDNYFLPHIYPSASTAIVYNDLNTMVKTIEANSSDKLPLFIERGHLKLDLSNSNLAQTPPTIAFRKINPTKYEVKVENATAPFFLVFSESYHPKWKAYVETEDRGQKAEGRKRRTENRGQKTEDRRRKTGNGKRETENRKWGIIAEYPKVNVKEARHEMRFTPKDVSYLFKKPLPEKNHLLVNGYANAWYIDPKEIGSSNFTITLYFWPQSLFYLGLFVSGFTLIGCTIYLGYSGLRKKKVTRNL